MIVVMIEDETIVVKIAEEMIIEETIVEVDDEMIDVNHAMIGIVDDIEVDRHDEITDHLTIITVAEAIVMIDDAITIVAKIEDPVVMTEVAIMAITSRKDMTIAIEEDHDIMMNADMDMVDITDMTIAVVTADMVDTVVVIADMMIDAVHTTTTAVTLNTNHVTIDTDSFSMTSSPLASFRNLPYDVILQ